jgi:predicted aspartyl protease
MPFFQQETFLAANARGALLIGPAVGAVRMRRCWLACWLQIALSMTLTVMGATPVAPPALDPQSMQAQSPDDLLFAAPTRLDHIGRILVAVRVNGQGPFRFIVDTGANYSTVSPSLVSKLGLQPATAASMWVNGITGSEQVPTVPILELQAGDLVIENKQLPVVWAPLMAGADGILGIAGLTDERLFVDFAHDRVTLARAHHDPDPHGFARIAARRIHGGLISVAAKVGGVPVQAVIDTGSERTIANSALRDALYRRSRQEKLQDTNVYGATTDVASGKMELSPTIDLGSVRIGSVTLVFGDFHIFEVWGMTRRPAMIVGMDVLGTVAGLSIDFQRAEIFIDSDLHYRSANGQGLLGPLASRATEADD